MTKEKKLKVGSIPEPTITRLCKIYGLLDEMESQGKTSVSSTELGKRIGAASHNIRKDITYLGETGTIGSGYEVPRLRSQISSKLGFYRERKACIIGLGQLGMAIINYVKDITHGFTVVAGFDSNINKLETLVTEIPLYPSYEIEEVVRQEKIDLAVMAVPAKAAENIVNRLIKGGIKGIVNFSPVVLNTNAKNIFITNIDVVGEFRFLSALCSLEEDSSLELEV
ncbi:MAG: redox-sensing transcriptional repressor Rex [bacterium]|nr:redox-sensing transcriptional repressor Rex [bacterium]